MELDIETNRQENYTNISQSGISMWRKIQNIITINSFTPGLQFFYSKKSGTIIPYAVLWKCASDGIIRNLHPTTVNGNLPMRSSIVHEINSPSNVRSTMKAMEGLPRKYSKFFFEFL
jgi:hypothetical protein